MKICLISLEMIVLFLSMSFMISSWRSLSAFSKASLASCFSKLSKLEFESLGRDPFYILATYMDTDLLDFKGSFFIWRCHTHE